ncbi:hypothetical protein PTKIN_Ptkin14bG0149400 [Pterospermum kingtungense]
MKREDKNKRDEELAEKLFNFLKVKKCLVIVDDIYSVKPAFPMKETRSKILITSRNKEIVSYADRRGYVHELECLNEENSWELFHRIAFHDKDSSEM